MDNNTDKNVDFDTVMDDLGEDGLEDLRYNLENASHGLQDALRYVANTPEHDPLFEAWNKIEDLLTRVCERLEGSEDDEGDSDEE